MKKLVTISREYGSGGRIIGKLVAEKLGVPFYDKEIIEMAIEESGFSREMIESAELTNLIASGDIIIELNSDVKQDEKVKVGDTITYTAKVSNISGNDLNNIIAKV